jgi:hypothetical protein
MMRFVFSKNRDRHTFGCTDGKDDDDDIKMMMIYNFSIWHSYTAIKCKILAINFFLLIVLKKEIVRVENICRAGGNENLGMYLMCLISQ